MANPVTNKAIGSNRRCVRKYDKQIDDVPTISAKSIIPHSTAGSAKKPRPSKGKLVISTGTAAQCIAHNVDAVIPILSSREVSLCDRISANI